MNVTYTLVRSAAPPVADSTDMRLRLTSGGVGNASATAFRRTGSNLSLHGNPVAAAGMGSSLGAPQNVAVGALSSGVAKDGLGLRKGTPGSVADLKQRHLQPPFAERGGAVGTCC
ncbi:MAG: hypothetical protein EOO41_04345, partial [Methanobacteriota archaeon]